MKKQAITTASGRYFLSDRIREEVNFYLSEQSQGEAPPPVQKPAPSDARIIELPSKDTWNIAPCDLQTAIANRQSHRRFTNNHLSLEELAFLLWATQGVRQIIHEAAVLRTVPSAGCRHPFETYLAIQRVESLEQGIYRHLPMNNALVFVKSIDNAVWASHCSDPRTEIYRPGRCDIHLDGYPQSY
jgi:hypothetical protein